jgi:hypothetical protein
VTLLTINHTTRRITASIQHVADVPPEEIDQLVVPEIDVIPAMDVIPEIDAISEPVAVSEIDSIPTAGEIPVEETVAE